MKKYLLGIFSLVVVCLAIDPYTDVGTDTVLYNRTNRNVRPNGANQIFNNLGGTNLTVESNIVAGESITVGRTNSTTSGSITLGTTNFTLIVKLTINTNGDFVMSDGTNTMMVLQKSSGSDGTTNKFLAADGHYYTSSGGGESLWTNSGNQFFLIGHTNTIFVPTLDDGYNIGTFGPASSSGFYTKGTDDPSYTAIFPYRVYNYNDTLGALGFLLDPTVGDGNPSFFLNTQTAHTTGDIGIVYNHNTPICELNFEGSLWNRKSLSSGNNTTSVWGTPSNEALVAIRVPGVNGDSGSPELWLSRNTAANLTSDYTFIDAFPDSSSSTLTVGVKTSSVIRSVLMFADSSKICVQYSISGVGSCQDIAGNGDPEGNVIGQIGSTYRRFDGGTGTSFYVKESGAGLTTGWIAK